MKYLPNILSSSRILLAPVFLYLYIQDDMVWRSLGIAVFAAAAITDYFDGKLARQYKLESDFGVFIDPLADKFLTVAGFLTLPFINIEQFPWWAVFAIIARDILVTVLRMVANRRNRAMRTRKTAKMKTMVQMLFLYVMLLFGLFIQTDIFIGDMTRWIFDTGILYYMMLFVTGLTVYSGLEYVFMNRWIFKSDVQPL